MSVQTFLTFKIVITTRNFTSEAIDAGSISVIRPPEVGPNFEKDLNIYVVAAAGRLTQGLPKILSLVDPDQEVTVKLLSKLPSYMNLTLPDPKDK